MLISWYTTLAVNSKFGTIIFYAILKIREVKEDHIQPKLDLVKNEKIQRY